MASRQLNWTVAGCLLLFIFVYFTVITCVIVPWLSYSVPGVLNLGLLTFDTGIALGCYLACVFADPGSVPADFVPEQEDGRAVLEVKKKGGAVRFCQKCKCYKPPRSHHCRICQRCVLRMCHHCPWINNCVGHGNYKAFLLFLIYVNAAVVHAFGLLVAHAVHVVSMHSEDRVHSLKATMMWATLQTVCMAVSLPLAIGLAMLLVWNAYLVYTNKTTVEHYEGVTARILASRAGQAWQHPYDMGLYTNLSTICGRRPHLWLFPVKVAAYGDGLGHVTMWDADVGALPVAGGAAKREVANYW